MEMECLQRAFEVVDSYLLLDGVSILQVRPRADLNGHTHTQHTTHTHLASLAQSYSQTVVEACECYMEEVKPECLKPILTVVGRMVQLYPEESPQLIRPCLNKMMNKIFGAEDVSHPSLE